jgi:hypothetical protein
VQGAELRIQGSGFRVQGSRAQGPGFGVQGLGCYHCRITGFEPEGVFSAAQVHVDSVWAKHSALRVQCLGFRA